MPTFSISFLSGFWENQRRTNRRGHIQNPVDRRQRDLINIDKSGFQWRVVSVAGCGFFADGYTLFSSNFALPMIGYIYWNQDTKSDHETGINSVTLCGCIVGQLLLGVLADHWGRKRLYGWELVILVASSLGVAMSSAGRTVTETVDGVVVTESSMRISAWLMFVRFIAGVGIGGEYPLTAVITAEYAPTKHRARMMATVFLMQSLGQAFAATVSIIAIASVKDHFNNPTVAIDSMWRWIYGVGAIFPAIAMLLRMTIPESPRFTFDVLQNPKQASKDTKSMLNGFFTRRRASFHHNQPRNLENGHGTNTNNPAEPIDLPGFPPKKSWSDLSDYLITRGNWRYLLGTALTWFLMDFAFYGLGLNAPQIISIVWNGELAFKTQKPPSWFSDPEPLQPGQLPYGNFRHNATHTLIIVSIGAISGSLILIWLVNHISRKRLMVLGFLVLAVLLFVIGGIFSSSMYSEGSQILVAALYGLCQFLFNLGPNGLTFLYPAEIFPTRYRCTMFGISAAFGKLGSVAAQGALSRVQLSPHQAPQHLRLEPQSLGHVLLAFGAVMLVGAIFAVWLLPEVQDPNTKLSLDLETLAEGRAVRVDEVNGGGPRESEDGGGVGEGGRVEMQEQQQHHQQQQFSDDFIVPDQQQDGNNVNQKQGGADVTNMFPLPRTPVSSII